MRNLGKKLFGLCLLLFIIGAGGLVWLFSKQEYFTFSLKEVNDERVVEKPIKGLNLSTDTTDVIVSPSTNSSAIVRLAGNAAEQQMDRLQFSSDVGSDGILRVMVREQSHLNLFFMGNGHLQVEVLLPEAMYESIALKSETGDIRSSALQSKQATISTSTGDIELAGFQGDELQIDTDTGDMRLLRIHSALKVDSSTGDVNKLVLSEVTYPVDIRTDTGDVHISADKKPTDARLELESDTGDIHVDWPELKYDQKQENLVEATVGSGSSLLSVKTATGDIRIQ
ncbi:DUF4097 family beta strand repeat-containing protein [Brevibacillus choshinensis]|uniref:DUF4097 family beta strand repeat protein n=1 Tax=Brevibacillus choshinensis TaxID=54911 RepID=A0ABX7FUK9_BRECH|nr:DUF4097 family beta strand repeat-containing protein [Brevibacillus choshinensis]QRG69383.1 DUF4097 family beta strand repeat protein [Brevibacillus choshinensis]